MKLIITAVIVYYTVRKAAVVILSVKLKCALEVLLHSMVNAIEIIGSRLMCLDTVIRLTSLALFRNISKC